MTSFEKFMLYFSFFACCSYIGNIFAILVEKNHNSMKNWKKRQQSGDKTWKR